MHRWIMKLVIALLDRVVLIHVASPLPKTQLKAA